MFRYSNLLGVLFAWPQRVTQSYAARLETTINHEKTMNQDENELKSTAEAGQLERRVSTHTPGPWQWIGSRLETEDGQCVLWPQNVPNDSNLEWAQRLGACGVAAEDQAEANARLIAAAPDLLEALIEVVAISDRKHDAWDRAKAAINKATANAKYAPK